MLLVAAGTLAGYLESHKLTARVEQLEAFLRFLSLAQTEIRFAALPVEQIVQKHGRELEFLRLCAQNCGGGKAFSTVWEQSVTAGTGDGGLLSQDIELLRGFGSGFGASDVDGQLSHCALYTELIGESLKSAREEKGKKSRLYQTLGVFAGITAALVLC